MMCFFCLLLRTARHSEGGSECQYKETGAWKIDYQHIITSSLYGMSDTKAKQKT